MELERIYQLIEADLARVNEELNLVSDVEFPSDEAAMTYSMALGSQGNVRITSLKAFTKEEFAGIVEKLP